MGVHSGLEMHRFHQAEEPRSPDLRKGDQIFVFVRLRHGIDIYDQLYIESNGVKGQALHNRNECIIYIKNE